MWRCAGIYAAENIHIRSKTASGRKTVTPGRRIGATGSAQHRERREEESVPVYLYVPPLPERERCGDIREEVDVAAKYRPSREEERRA